MVHRIGSAAPEPAQSGERASQERRVRQWTLDQLVEVSGVSRRMLIHIEQGAANPSIAILLRLCNALGGGLSALVESPGPTGMKLTRSGTGPVLWSGQAGGRAVLVASTVPRDVSSCGTGRWAEASGTPATPTPLEPASCCTCCEGAVTIEAGELGPIRP